MKPTSRFVSVMLASAMLLAACSKPEAPSEDIRPVRYVRASQNDQQAGTTFSGEIRARHEANLGFRVGGKITARLVNPGDTVKKGQLLARLDPQDYALDQSAKTAQLAAARSDLAQQEADLKRYRELLGKNFISQAQFDKLSAATDAARARFKQASAELGASQNQVGYTNLLADSDGVISTISAEPGMVVAAGQTVARLAHDGQREVAISIPENALETIRNAPRVTVTLWSGNHRYEGSLRELAGDADPATRTYAARIAIKNPDAALRLGMTATVTLPGSARQGTFRLPLTALLDENGKHFVWVVDASSHRVKRTPVTVIALDSDMVSLSAALPADAMIVTAGVHLLRDNQPVRLLDN